MEAATKRTASELALALFRAGHGEVRYTLCLDMGKTLASGIATGELTYVPGLSLEKDDETT